MAALVASRMYVAGAGFLASVIWVRTFDKSTYGRYQLIVATTAAVATFCLPGLNDAALISSARRKDGNLAGILRQRLVVALAGAIVIAGWGVLRYSADTTMMLGFIIAAILFAPIQLGTIWQGVTNGKRRFKLLTFGQILMASGSLIGIGAFWVARVSDADMLPWGILGSQGLLAVATLFLVSTVSRMKETTDTDPDIVRYGHHVTAASLLAWVFASDRLIVGEILSEADVAILSVAILLPAQIKIFFSAFEQVFLPKVTAAASVADAWTYMQPRMRWLSICYTALGVVGYVAMPYVIPLFFSHRYVAAVPYAKWLWLVQCLGSPFTFLASILNSQRDKRFLYLKSVASPLVTLILFAVLIPRYGLGGAIASRVINGVVLVIFHVAYFSYVLREDHSRLK